jgi:hypothetical protein
VALLLHLRTTAHGANNSDLALAEADETGGNSQAAAGDSARAIIYEYFKCKLESDTLIQL